MNEYYTEENTDSVAESVIGLLAPSETSATVLCLEGDLGAGKTTLTKAIARALGVDETVASPTFVIAKFYAPTTGGFTKLVHIDAYRIESVDELVPLGFEALLKEPGTLVIIEWPERIKEALPESVTWLTITHEGDERHIEKRP